MGLYVTLNQKQKIVIIVDYTSGADFTNRLKPVLGA